MTFSSQRVVFVHWAQPLSTWPWLHLVVLRSTMNLAFMHGISRPVIWLFVKLAVIHAIQPVGHWIWCLAVYWPQAPQKWPPHSPKSSNNTIHCHAINSTPQKQIEFYFATNTKKMILTKWQPSPQLPNIYKMYNNLVRTCRDKIVERTTITLEWHSDKIKWFYRTW